MATKEEGKKHAKKSRFMWIDAKRVTEEKNMLLAKIHALWNGWEGDSPIAVEKNDIDNKNDKRESERRRRKKN